MNNNDTRISVYIEKSSDFAKPILNHLRELVHKACPVVEETWKWSFPHFDYKGEMMCSMAAFKQHCAFGFWKASLMKDYEKIFSVKEKSSMGHLGQIKNLKDLPPDKVLLSCIKEAMKLNDQGIKVVKAKPVTKKEIKTPAYLTEALKKNKKALVTFEDLSPSHKREYIEWLTEAKTETTRNKRLESALEWMSEGKSRNWKYVSK